MVRAQSEGRGEGRLSVAAGQVWQMKDRAVGLKQEASLPTGGFHPLPLRDSVGHLWVEKDKEREREAKGRPVKETMVVSSPLYPHPFQK